MRILIAEDDSITRLLIKRCLEQLHHDTVLAADGAEAWSLMQDHAFDVVITDWMMPEMNGIELIRRIRERRSDQYVFVILLTALTGKEDFIAGMEAGADDYLLKPLDREALKARLIAAARIVSLHRELAQRKAELENLNHTLYETGRIDRLTGVSNRLRMEEDLETIHSRVRRYGHSYCLALVDVDNFKAYNDACGHAAGDQVLRAVAQTLRAQCRVGDEVYRYGGEEFLVVLPEQAADKGSIALERMRSAVESLAIHNPGIDPPGAVTISVGITIMEPHQSRSIEEVARDADQALYNAKKQGRNRVVWAEVPAVA
jgi:diguanylate cyclase (GGDEF)-like protein